MFHLNRPETRSLELDQSPVLDETRTPSFTSSPAIRG
jgi:hypothetical protein